MTGCFEIYIKRPKNGMVFIPHPGDEGKISMPDMKDSDKFEYEHIASVEVAGEIGPAINDWWYKAGFCEEFIVRCELPV